MKTYITLIVVVLFAGLFAFAQKTKADEIVTLDWFAVETYEVNGETRASFDFYYFEDNDPNSYLGSLSIAYDCNGNFVIDEIVDVTAYGNLTEDEIFTAIDAFGQNVNYAWNVDPEYHELAWGNGIPQMWEYLQDELNTVRAELLNNSCEPAVNYTVFLPVISNN